MAAPIRGRLLAAAPSVGLTGRTSGFATLAANGPFPFRRPLPILAACAIE
jgi:hypothetical protein